MAAWRISKTRMVERASGNREQLRTGPGRPGRRSEDNSKKEYDRRVQIGLIWLRTGFSEHGYEPSG
jgi:hypothetical protein